MFEEIENQIFNVNEALRDVRKCAKVDSSLSRCDFATACVVIWLDKRVSKIGFGDGQRRLGLMTQPEKSANIGFRQDDYTTIADHCWRGVQLRPSCRVEVDAGLNHIIGGPAGINQGATAAVRADGEGQSIGAGGRQGILGDEVVDQIVDGVNDRARRIIRWNLGEGEKTGLDVPGQMSHEIGVGVSGDGEFIPAVVPTDNGKGAIGGSRGRQAERPRSAKAAVVGDREIGGCGIRILQSERDAAGVGVNQRNHFNWITIIGEVAGKTALETVRSVAGEIVLAERKG